MQKKLELLLDLYVMDKSVLQFNGIKLDENNEETETITQVCKRLKINTKFVKSKKTIPEKVSKTLKEKMNILRKIFTILIQEQKTYHLSFES